MRNEGGGPWAGRISSGLEVRQTCFLFLSGDTAKVAPLVLEVDCGGVVPAALLVCCCGDEEPGVQEGGQDLHWFRRLPGVRFASCGSSRLCFFLLVVPEKCLLDSFCCG